MGSCKIASKEILDLLNEINAGLEQLEKGVAASVRKQSTSLWRTQEHLVQTVEADFVKTEGKWNAGVDFAEKESMNHLMNQADLKRSMPSYEIF